MRNSTAPVRRHRRGAAPLAALLLLSLVVAAPTSAQDWTGGLSRWSALGTQMPTTTPSSWPALTPSMTPSMLSPWSTFGSPMTSPALPSLPYSYGSGFGNQWPGLSGLNLPYGQQMPGAWQAPTYAGGASGCTDGGSGSSYQPDLTGMWRGSAGETVEIERNRARIWGGHDKPCSCVFFLVGQRLIAYSPDTDVVRKYWYQGAGSQFTLIDESGNPMTFWRTR